MNWIEIVFWSCFGIVFYSFLGYGILLGFLIKIKRALGAEKYSTDESYEPTVALIIPCFNEESYIAEKIQNTLEIDYPKEKMDIIFISDGSNDNTSKIARLEIDLEGKQRMCKIQESRCNQLQSLYNLFHCKIILSIMY